MSHVRAQSRETAASPGPALEYAASFLTAMYGQDFGLLARSDDNHPPFRFADTKELDRVDPPAITNRGRVLRSREPHRLFMAAMAWTVNALVGWNTRHGQRWNLSDRPDHLLRDIGIRRDQINVLVSGSHKLGTWL